MIDIGTNYSTVTTVWYVVHTTKKYVPMYSTSREVHTKYAPLFFHTCAFLIVEFFYVTQCSDRVVMGRSPDILVVGSAPPTVLDRLLRVRFRSDQVRLWGCED